jgi:Zn finger protein HypA/HybF involved in hydrogenase expression
MSFLYAAYKQRELECPKCGEPIMVEPQEQVLECPACKAKLDLVVDADYDEGTWRDCSRLYPHKD